MCECVCVCLRFKSDAYPQLRALVGMEDLLRPWVQDSIVHFWFTNCSLGSWAKGSIHVTAQVGAGLHFERT